MEYDRFQEILQEEAEKIPEKFYEGLNGGVIISEETKQAPMRRTMICTLQANICTATRWENRS